MEGVFVSNIIVSFLFFFILMESTDFRKNADDWKHW